MGLTAKKMTEVTDMLYQHTTKYENIELFLPNTVICKYCADKLKGNKDVARSVFNHLAVVDTPDCTNKLNLFERALIKFCITSITVLRLCPVSNKQRPENELIAALKGCIAYLPVNESVTAKFLPKTCSILTVWCFLLAVYPASKILYGPPLLTCAR